MSSFMCQMHQVACRLRNFELLGLDMQHERRRLEDHWEWQ
jgi:hypothetical protein